MWPWRKLTFLLILSTTVFQQCPYSLFHFFWHQRLRLSIYGHFSSHILNICGIFSRWLQTKGYIFLSSLVTHVKPPRRHPAMNNKDKIWSDHSFCFVISCSHMKIKQTLSQVVALLTMIKKNTKKTLMLTANSCNQPPPAGSTLFHFHCSHADVHESFRPPPASTIYDPLDRISVLCDSQKGWRRDKIRKEHSSLESTQQSIF